VPKKVNTSPGLEEGSFIGPPRGCIRTTQLELVHVARSTSRLACFGAVDEGFSQDVGSRTGRKEPTVGMHAYVINLARSPDRLAHIVAELQRTGLDYEITPAVDGRSLDLNDSTLIDPSLPSRCPFPAGAAGCALSHFHIYRKILEESRDRALILEDDVILPDDLGDLADDVGGHLTGAELALLNYSGRPPDPLRISSEGSIELPSSRLLALPIDVGQLVNSGAYVITREACARMIEHILPIRATADDWRFFYEEGFLDRVRCVLPQPVPKCPKFESTIGLYSLGNGLKARLVGPIVRHRIPLLQQAILYRRQRVMRHWDRAEVVDVPFIEKPSRLG
jgi:glycosyl transferase, family 25